jgi:hypothetical protein
MKALFSSILILLVFSAIAQDSVMKKAEYSPVKIFSTGRTINARTTEVIGFGKMEFNVTHNFGDIGGKFGGVNNFFGLDNSTDIRIGFHVGVGKHTEVVFARAKGGGPIQGLLEFGLKQQLMQQTENESSHPVSMAIYANTVIATKKRNPLDNEDNSFENFSDRISNIVQLIIAKKIKSVSLQINPTFMTRGYAISYDQKSMFALGGAIKVPIITNRLNLIVDYFHSFRSKSSKDSMRVNKNLTFYDPIGVGFEILTSGHIFRMNFTNATEILENRFIPRTTTNWGKGEFRWGFNISRNFTLWRPKNGK